LAEDPFAIAVDRIAHAGRKACEAIATAVGALEDQRAARMARRPLVDIVDELVHAREGAGLHQAVGDVVAVTEVSKPQALERSEGAACCPGPD
jgi:hypothetical protein